MITLRSSHPNALLGLDLDAGAIEAISLRRTNGSVRLQQSTQTSIPLQRFSANPEQAGRELRRRLLEAGIKEKRCLVSLPISWVFTLQVKLPDLPESEIASFLTIQAERGFSQPLEDLAMATSRYRSGEGANFATIAAVPKSQLESVEKALRYARLKLAGFTIGHPALPSLTEKGDGMLALWVEQNSLEIQVAAGGGLVALRHLNMEMEPACTAQLAALQGIVREIKITLGNLPSTLRETVRKVLIFGEPSKAQRLASALMPLLHPLNLLVEAASPEALNGVPADVPLEIRASPAFAGAARHLFGRVSPFELAPSSASRWPQIAARFASRKFLWAGTIAAAVVLVVMTAVLWQRWRLSALESRWQAIRPQVEKVEATQQQIRKFRPWFDESFRTLTIFRKLTEAFPEDGTVSAKTLDIKDRSVVTCTGVAGDNQAFLKMLDQLGAAKEIADLKVEQVRGKTPLQFTINFRWTEPGSHD